VVREEELGEEFEVEVMLAQCQELKGEVMGVHFVRHVMLLIAEDHQGYLCLFP
jgi:hypothetical protein